MVLSLTDRGEPTALSGPDQSITFTIARNDIPPLFFDLDNGVYRATINENDPIGTDVKVVEARDNSPSVSVEMLASSQNCFIKMAKELLK